MTRDDFIKAVRRSGERFRIDNVRILTPTGELTGVGTLLVTEKQFVLDVTVSALPGSSIPPFPKGIVMRSGFWQLSGIIAHSLEFQVPRIAPSCHRVGPPEAPTLTLHSHRLELAPGGLDALTYAEIDRMLEDFQLGRSADANAGNLSTDSRTEISSAESSIDVAFHAVLRDFKLIAKNAGTEIIEQNEFLGENRRNRSDTYHCKIDMWWVGLIQDEHDLHIYLRSAPEFRSLGEHHDWQLFRAFLDALAFTHGQHAWPSLLQHRRDGKLVLDRIQINNAVARTPHAPFTEKLWFSSHIGNISWDFSDALQKAYQFFSINSTFVNEISEVLYLFREAGASHTPDRVTLLTLCSLFESVIRVVYEERTMANCPPNRAFEVARGWLRQIIGPRIKELEVSEDVPQQHAMKRFLAIIINAEATNMREKFKSVSEDLGLKPAAEWEQMFRLWNRFRNPVSHRPGKSDGTEEALRKNFLAESAIAGAINCIVLKIMGYTGLVSRSMFEDRYIAI